jgi:hypothetical protein
MTCVPHDHPLHLVGDNPRLADYATCCGADCVNVCRRGIMLRRSPEQLLRHRSQFQQLHRPRVPNDEMKWSLLMMKLQQGRTCESELELLSSLLWWS